MGLTDKEQLYAAKLAYFNVEEEVYQKFVDENKGQPPTMQQWVDHNYKKYVCAAMGVDPKEVDDNIDIEEFIASQNLSIRPAGDHKYA